MKWAAAVIETADLDRALAGLREEVGVQLDGEAPDLVLVFFTVHFRGRHEALQRGIEEAWPGATWAGCTGLGVIGQGREVEQRPAISLAAACLPGVEAVVRHIDMDRLPDDDAPQEAWQELLDLPDWAQANLVLLSDPFSGSIENLLSGLDFAWPRGTKIGGLASGGGQAGENVMLAGNRALRCGTVAVALRGDLAIDPVVAQGCRPIGEPLAVTCCERNLVMELEGHPPLDYLKALLPRLSSYDRELLASSLFLGLQMDTLNSVPGQGDYLIRNLIGIDHEAGAMAVGAHPEEGQIVQFHLRDKLTSAQDLIVRLDGYRQREESTSARGALMFSCIGRGEYLYGAPNHDSGLFARRLGPMPIAGFFCNGEIGPVAGSTYVHGYTSSFGIFRPLPAPDDR